MSRSHRWSLWVALLLILTLLLAACAQPATPAPAKKLEIFSWWTAGGEAEGLEAMFTVYRQKYPGVEIINATVAGGAGAQAKAVLKTRMLGGDPPDSFQVHGGAELIDTWMKTGYMENITDLWKSEGWMDKFPKQLIDLVSHEGKIYSVPVNVHRGNVLWYNKKIFDQYGLQPPTTFDEFFQVAEALKAKGVTPLALGDKLKWEAAHLFETVLAGVLGAEKYRGLWTGQTPWTGPEVAKAFEIFGRMLDYVNEDHAAHTWDSATQLVLDGKVAMTDDGGLVPRVFPLEGSQAGRGLRVGPCPEQQGALHGGDRHFRPAQEGPPSGAGHRLAEGLRLEGGSGGLQPQEGLHLRSPGLRSQQVRCVSAVLDGRLRPGPADPERGPRLGCSGGLRHRLQRHHL
jgi:ABC-type glycerol-3-phosphate transport system substrate-binding protein